MRSSVPAIPSGPRQSPAEAFANALSHGVALVAALIGGPPVDATARPAL